MLKDFKSFILKGNALDLAVGVVIGAAFGAVVTSIVTNLLTPLTTIACTPNPETKQCAGFENLAFEVGNSTFKYGQVINDIISLLLIGAAVFFLVVRPMTKLEERRAKSEPEDLPSTRPCPECKSEIPREATRCAHCAIKVEALT